MVQAALPDRLVLWHSAEDSKTELITARTDSTLKLGRKDRGNRWPSVAIKDDAVSQKHAELRWNETHWEAIDVGSSNGTTLNGCTLVADVPSQPLKSGDTLTLGNSVVLSIEVWQAPEEDATVEQYLRAMQAQLQAHTQLADMQAQWELHANNWRQHARSKLMSNALPAAT